MKGERKIGVLTSIALPFIFFTTVFTTSLPAESTSEDTIQNPPTSIQTFSPETSVQDTINHAPSGSTVHLAATTYTEILTINKPLHLQGQGPSDTLLKAQSPTNGYAIIVIAEGVTISGLAIINQAAGRYTTCIKVCANNTTIQDCAFQDTPIGIALWSSTNTITDCDFTNCTDEGIVLLGSPITPCSTNTITSCTFTQNCDGIELQHATHNTIAACTFTKNTHAGIDAITSHNINNTFSQCTFSQNQGFGIYLSGATQNLITGCSFSDDTVTFVHASDTILQNSHVNTIHLIDDSTLRVEDCKDIEQSTIITHQSSYEIIEQKQEILSQQKNQKRTTQFTLLLQMLSHLRILQMFYEHLNHLRM